MGILLQHYHHLATMLYSWYGGVFVWQYNNTNTFFAGMNLCVHTIMYSWYAATRTGWRSPKSLMMFVTLIQLLQMVAGVTIVLIATYSTVPGCGTWMREEPTGAKCCLFMYASYFVLFAKLFVDNYLTGKKSEEGEQSQGGVSCNWHVFFEIGK